MESAVTEQPAVRQGPWDADDPANYLPPSIVTDPAFHNDKPLEFGANKAPEKSEPVPDQPSTSTELPEVASLDKEDSSNAGEECLPNVPESEMPQMKPLPDMAPKPSTSSAANVADMALQVAMEVEEKRKKAVREKLMEVFKYF